METILGIDPGSRITGFGVIKSDGNKHIYVASGCVRTKGKKIPERLQQIFAGISEVVDFHKPMLAAIEDVFMHKNANSALKLGQARGAAITAMVAKELEVAEYSPREIKLAVVGTGAADKAQVQHMVKLLLNLSGELQEDAADALAIAICHAHNIRSNRRGDPCGRP